MSWGVRDGMIFFTLLVKNNHMATQTTAAPKAAKNSRLREFFIEQLQDIYWAEQKLVKTLPKLSEASRSPELRQAFDSHLTETRNHVSRIEKAFSLMEEEAEATECPALKGIAKEGEDIIDETEEGTAQRDVGLIFAGQKAEHYEIATYGSLIQLARDMGETEVASLLQDTLKEEKAADQKLTQLAQSGINREAALEMKN
jgi:ferritin-like metal-binding protein YciE